jgi:sorbitol-specific phosphotransferase system component IIBC
MFLIAIHNTGYLSSLKHCIVWFICISAVTCIRECRRTTEKEEEEAAKKEKKERNKERKEKERKQRKEEDEDGEGVWERVKGGIIPTVSTFLAFC